MAAGQAERYLLFGQPVQDAEDLRLLPAHHFRHAIGIARPMSVLVDTFGTETVAVEKIERAVGEVFDFRPAAMIAQLDLRRPIYRPTAAYGHFGRTESTFSWERTDRAEALKAAL